MVEALISLDSDLNSSDYHGETPLHLASQEGNQSAIVSGLFLQLLRKRCIGFRLK